MATTNRDGSRAGNRGRGGRNNNPEGHNQYSGVMSTARENPVATFVAVGGAIAAGVFLWSRRNQISDQIGNLSDQVSEWREGMAPGSDLAADGNSDTTLPASLSPSRVSRRNQAEIAEEALTLKATGEAS